MDHSGASEKKEVKEREKDEKLAHNRQDSEVQKFTLPVSEAFRRFREWRLVNGLFT